MTLSSESELDMPSEAPQGIFDEKSNHVIESFGASLEQTGINKAFCVLFDENDKFKPKVFFRGELFEITKHTSRILNQMRYKIIEDLNGNF
jgi:hypothetical protein